MVVVGDIPIGHGSSQRIPVFLSEMGTLEDFRGDGITITGAVLAPISNLGQRKNTTKLLLKPLISPPSQLFLPIDHRCRISKTASFHPAPPLKNYHFIGPEKLQTSSPTSSENFVDNKCGIEHN